MSGGGKAPEIGSSGNCPRELYTRRAEALAAAYREANSGGAGGVILEVRTGGGNGGSLWPLSGDLPGGPLRGVGEAAGLAGGMRWGRG